MAALWSSDSVPEHRNSVVSSGSNKQISCFALTFDEPIPNLAYILVFFHTESGIITYINNDWKIALDYEVPV